MNPPTTPPSKLKEVHDKLLHFVVIEELNNSSGIRLKVDISPDLKDCKAAVRRLLSLYSLEELVLLENAGDLENSLVRRLREIQDSAKHARQVAERCEGLLNIIDKTVAPLDGLSHADYARVVSRIMEQASVLEKWVHRDATKVTLLRELLPTHAIIHKYWASFVTRIKRPLMYYAIAFVFWAAAAGAASTFIPSLVMLVPVVLLPLSSSICSYLAKEQELSRAIASARKALEGLDPDGLRGAKDPGWIWKSEDIKRIAEDLERILEDTVRSVSSSNSRAASNPSRWASWLKERSRPILQCVKYTLSLVYGGWRYLSSSIWYSVCCPATVALFIGSGSFALFRFTHPPTQYIISEVIGQVCVAASGSVVWAGPWDIIVLTSEGHAVVVKHSSRLYITQAPPLDDDGEIKTCEMVVDHPAVAPCCDQAPVTKQENAKILMLFKKNDVIHSDFHDGDIQLTNASKEQLELFKKWLQECKGATFDVWGNVTEKAFSGHNEEDSRGYNEKLGKERRKKVYEALGLPTAEGGYGRYRDMVGQNPFGSPAGKGTAEWMARNAVVQITSPGSCAPPQK